MRDYLAAIRRRWWIVLGAVLLAAGAALGLSLTTTAIYEAEAQMLVETRSTDTIFGTGVEVGGADAARAVETAIKVLEGERVSSRVKDDLGLRRDPPEADASVLDATDVVSVRVRHADPERAQQLADAYVRAYIDERREQSVDNLLAASAQVQNKIAELDDEIDALPGDDPQRSVLLAQQAGFRETLSRLQIDAALKTGGASVVKSAELPDDPVEPTPVRDTLLAVCIGLLAGLGIAFLVEHFDDSLRTEDDVKRAVPLPVLAVVPSDPPVDNRPVALSAPGDYAVEVYRGLRTNLQFLALDRPVKLIHVTSCGSAEGKTTTVSNLAVVLAQAGRSVAVVDGDLRRPRIHEVFATPQSPGFTDMLVGAPADLAAQVFHDDQDCTLTVFASGSVPSNPGEVLASNRCREVLADLAERFDYVIIDSAPVLPVADSIALAGAVDAVLLVTHARRTSRQALTEAVERLSRVGAPLVGVVLNRAKHVGGADYAYGYRSREPKRGRSEAAGHARTKGAPDNSSREPELAEEKAVVKSRRR